MYRKIAVFGIIGLAACAPKPIDQTDVEETVEDRPQIEMPDSEPAPERGIYNPTETRVNDLLHTKLDVSFDFTKAYLNGKATLTFKPYFYPTNTLVLDAKGFDLHKVELVSETGNQALEYDYDGMLIDITLDREYTREEEYTIYIEYTAKPNELEEGGSSAITSDKGLYFINPDSSEADKPTQVWTQGETESSSCWFPTIDSPNEKTTQEMYMTVPEEFVTLSNGKLMYQTPNNDGTRTDVWKQDLPHAPYLFMMGVGDFFIYEDSWTRADGSEMQVNYYVEHDYAEDALAIFGNTPKMLTFFSDILGVEYPWDKYSQIIVRDYVSGAMENTGAVIFGDFVQLHKRELIDGGYESIVAHELFHHWFGDLVTCESWSNLPLNESFADYSEYLWDEYHNGRNAADHTWEGALEGYLFEANGFGRGGGKMVDMIRFDYADKEDMFDSHSYAKGGRILHMLRKYVGDEAFFKALNVYLTDNAFEPAEIHHLRLAFEEVTGEDLNWFFNQWFLDKGHPVLKVEHYYDETAKVLTLSVNQEQDLEEVPLYRIPVFVDIYANGKVERHEIVIDQVEQEFDFLISTKPDLVNFDGEKAILCERTEIKSDEEWLFQFYNAPLYLDRAWAFDECINMKTEESAQLVLDAMSDPYYNLRLMALRNIKKAQVKRYFETELRVALIELAQSDSSSAVRAQAVESLQKIFSGDEELVAIYTNALQDSSYSVINAGMIALADEDPGKALDLAKQYENEDNSTIRRAVAEIYADYGNEDQYDFFENTANSLSAGPRYSFMLLFHGYLKKQNNATIKKGADFYQQMALGSSPWWIHHLSVQLLLDIQNEIASIQRDLEAKESILLEEGDPSELATVQQELKEQTELFDYIETLYPAIKENETNESVQGLLNNK